MAYQYRVVLGGGTGPLAWLPQHASHVQDWSIILPSLHSPGGQEGELEEVVARTTEGRLSILLEGRAATGRSSILKQVALDWSRGAAYCQVTVHFWVLPDYCQVGTDQFKVLATHYQLLTD